jgi:hypothetical protein
MRWIARIAATIVAALAFALPVAGATAHASEQAVSSKVTVQASCRYTVNGNNVAVRRAPDIKSHVIKRKDSGAHVTGPCHNYHNGRRWTQVYLGNGRAGWMASGFLLYNGRC